MISVGKISKYLKNIQISLTIIFIVTIIIISVVFINMGYSMANFGFAVTPILTILLIIIWDGYNSRKKEESLVKAFVTELLFNIDALINNCEIILAELNGFKEEQLVITALRPLKNEIWFLLNYNMPNSLYKGDILSKLGWVYYRVSDINENIRSRENYRINNVDGKKYNTTMVIYNSSISALTTTFIIFLEEFLNSEELKIDVDGIEKLNDSLNKLKTQNKEIQDFVIKKENSKIFN